MAVTRNSRSIVMSADNDAIAGRFRTTSIMFTGTGLTVGQQIKVTETGGAIIFDGVVEATSQNLEMVTTCQWFDGIVWDVKPAAGTSFLTVRYE